MGGSGWALIVVLFAASGDGVGALLDKETGKPAVFPTKEECTKELKHIGAQALNYTAFDLTKSVLKCVPEAEADKIISDTF